MSQQGVSWHHSRQSGRVGLLGLVAILGFIAKVAACVSVLIGLVLAFKRLWYGRTILKFVLRAVNTEADRDDNIAGYYDGSPFIRALDVTVTNDGLKPITIQYIRCTYSFRTKQGQTGEREAEACVNKRVGQGEHCSGLPKLQFRPDEIKSVCAVDSKGGKWRAPRKKIKELNALGPKQWS